MLQHLTPGMDGTNDVKEAQLQREFPPVASDSRCILTPQTIVDSTGHILAWVIPDALTSGRSVRVINSF